MAAAVVKRAAADFPAPVMVAEAVVASARPVVASVVASPPLQSNATTNATTNSNATTDRLVVAWRIEINRRRKSGGGWSYHWLYRFGSGRERTAVYGGTIDRLIALNPARWAAYQENQNE